MTLEEFRKAYPEFENVPSTTINTYLSLFLCRFTLDYGCMADHLQGLYVAHMSYLKTSPGAGPARLVGSRAVGDVSTSYLYPSQSDSSGNYSATKYGVEFWETIRDFGGGPLMTGDGGYPCGCAG